MSRPNASCRDVGGVRSAHPLRGRQSAAGPSEKASSCRSTLGWGAIGATWSDLHRHSPAGSGPCYYLHQRRDSVLRQYATIPSCPAQKAEPRRAGRLARAAHRGCRPSAGRPLPCRPHQDPCLGHLRVVRLAGVGTIPGGRVRPLLDLSGQVRRMGGVPNVDGTRTGLHAVREAPPPGTPLPRIPLSPTPPHLCVSITTRATVPVRISAIASLMSPRGRRLLTNSRSRSLPAVNRPRIRGMSRAGCADP